MRANLAPVPPYLTKIARGNRSHRLQPGLYVNMSSSSSNNQSHLSVRPSAKKPQPRRPAIKIPLEPSPWGPASNDLDVLVAEALKAQPHPRRTLPEFAMQGTTRDPVPPPSTPAEGTAMSERSPLSSRGPSPRSSGETKRVCFKETWTDDDGGSGRTSNESNREAGLAAGGRLM